MKFISIMTTLCVAAMSTSVFAADDGCYPFTQSGSEISLLITIAGVEQRALINSGMKTIGLSRSLAQQLNLVVEEVPPITPLRGVSIPQPDKISNVIIGVFGQEIEMDELYVLERAEPVAAMSLLMFREAILQIDYPKSRLCFLTRGSINLKDASNINMRVATDGAPAIEVVLNGDEEVWLKLELGLAGALSIDYATALALGFIDADSALESPRQLETLADTLQFGPFELGNLAVTYATQGRDRLRRAQSGFRAAGAAAGRRGVDTHGLLGYEILRHFVITVDFQENNMHIFAP